MLQKTDEKKSPARYVKDFLNDHLIRMACGGVIMDTERAQEWSSRLQTMGALEIEMVGKYVGAWRRWSFCIENSC
ncbi:uncharacterized protein EURHEDRAFT_413588 [Aspergillus ruber CBS 135680]|uniref:Uncharacterized protein n=1 Tax=Aspergillus ruber (strain CBS 135680) TaxID=1388766 RepID=A0A017SB01_ASPRC|nr:uncharacterized protein EURHEDRAFT_413588 [Aspergillus ruber CBS 135680]EYE93991.1 hypothetical protein EURHEDRAFT_413588 [Aspergillus ruber CBS 135680]